MEERGKRVKIIQPSFKIENAPKYRATLGHIERAARTCYQSEQNGDSEGFVRRIIKRGHESVLEHVSISVRIVCDRGVSHELVRHRLASFCLDEKTEVVAFRCENTRARSQKKWTLRQLWEWQGDPKRRGRLGLIRIRSVDENGVVVPGKIKQVIDSGLKKMLEVRCVSGRTVRATKDHLFLTPGGWSRLGELSAGSKLVANGVPALENKEWLERVYLEENNTLQETAALAGCCVTYVTKALRRYGINKPLSMRKNRQPGRGVKGMHSNEERERISERMTGSGNHRWKGDSVGSSGGRLRANKLYEPDECWGCGKTEKLERHHVDRNPVNNAPMNIKYLCQKCHKAFHFGQGALTVFADEILSIVDAGEARAFDLEMESEPHNFVANGIVVHNSQESTRYVRYDGDVEFVEPWSWAERDDATIFHYMSTWASAEDAYKSLLSLGEAPQAARAVLPNALKTEVVMTANLREWRHVFKLRCDKAAHPDMRRIMCAILAEFKETYPVFFEDIEG